MKKRFLALALGTLAFGVTLGGVKMGLGHQDAMMVKAEAAQNVVNFDCIQDQDIATETQIEKDGVKITGQSGKGTFKNSKYFQCFSGSSITIALSEPTAAVVVKKVTFTCTATGSSKYGPGCFSVTEGGYTFDKSGNSGTWIGSKKSITFSATGGQVRMTKISVELGSDSSSPITSFTAKLADPNSVFCVGDEVALSDFVFTATREDATTDTLTTGVTIENPVLVEGENVIKFHYVSGETPLECQLVINAIKGNFYIKSTDTADIVAGKKIYIANTDGTMILDKQNDNNRAEIKAEARGNKIVAQDSYTSLLVLPAKNGTFALYDEKAGGVLYAASSSKNYLRTETVFADIDANSFANISYSKDAWSIQFTGSNSNKNLRYNSSSKLFSCYGSGQAAPSIYVSSDAPVTFGTETWAETFLAKLNEICDPTGNTALTEAKWSEAKATFDALSIPDKMAIKYGNFEGEKMKQALAGYDFIIKTKYASISLNDFLDRREETRANALMLPGATDSTTWTLVGIGAVTIAASASLLFFRRKKSN